MGTRNAGASTIDQQLLFVGREQVCLFRLSFALVHVIRAWASLSERSLQYGGAIPKCCFHDVSLATHLSSQRPVLMLTVWQATIEIMQEVWELARMNT